mmetsp:Transcript_18926/g.28029  ORF Transcript_18926/g.28029 Transcript_18926/m.28029 type:complete len:318 (-) Transcript_18926:152-1105(-)
MNEYPQLWQRDPDTKIRSTGCYSNLDGLSKKFSFKPCRKSYNIIWKNSLVIGQEFVLTCFFLTRFRIELQVEQNETIENPLSQNLSLFAVSSSLFLVIWFSRGASRSTRYHKAQTRLMDMLLLAMLLRLISAVLKTLTGSYSSNTVHALAIAGMLVHWWGCDYCYANGTAVSSPFYKDEEKNSSSSLSLPVKKREPFFGGTVSLNAAFFSTTLLASRMNSNWSVCAFVSTSVTIFAFYPVRRHLLYVTSPKEAPYVVLATIILFSTASWLLLQSKLEKLIYGAVLLIVCFLAPTWKYYLQDFKSHIHGPWDIAHIRR